MRKSVKLMVGTRVAAAFLSMVLFSVLTTKNIILMDRSEENNIAVNALLSRAQQAEAAHYKWASNLSNALYAGTEFTGSTDPTGCVLGQWIYGEAGTDDEAILDLRSRLQPLHEELHQSAVHVLELLKTDPEQAQKYYQETIQGNLTVLVGLLDEVIARGTVLNDASAENMQSIVSTMHIVTAVGLSLALVCLISLVFYVMKRIVRPILMITNKTRPLQEGRLKIDLDYRHNDEIGDLSGTLHQSLEQINRYVEDINHILHELSTGNFNVTTSVPFIGDFRSIEESIDSFTTSLSSAMSNISKVEHEVFDHAKNLSNSSQMLAQGATEQASAVEELSATLNELSRSAKQNIDMAAHAQDNAKLTGDQVSLSSDQMKLLVEAMEDISTTSTQIEKIISTIENISFQTNILALNAAVEASRAGESGRGFAVVAEEVRSLAGQSEQAAKATKNLIENSVKAAERGNQIVTEVSSTLQKTIELVLQSNDTIGEITGAVRTEATAISQVAEGLEQIAAVVQTNSANSEESATVSVELFEQVNLLQEQTSGFRLK
ncbi:MAG: methyl-accepting chemotaxis protein [Eubacterium sp.]|nr:methyl-accepting chemotaxis protein [Eubacterium sp.]MCM1214909.1 methyl-accepting chemotaxis protein [Lachnospiraceae bacterium]MCM1303536.1 methyl-accepting chemotaxis protein [Butyrivibrio sp.]MCM1342700.1 methyl-accepting chemotaxis protein [Muribaculaceae bacterium]MCM1238985.1 methyl-accepting chemotaxis protein [Lachnospiraceae bacterium]